MLNSEQILHGVYEYSRDSDRYPACWKSLSNCCMPHFHNSLEFVYVLRGEVKAVLGGRPFDVREREILMVPSLTVHYFYTESSSESIVLIVPLDYIPAFRKQFETHTFAGTLYRDPEPDSELRRCMQSLSARPLPGDSPVLRGYTYLIVGLLVELVGLRELADIHNGSLMRNVLTYLQENYRSPVTLRELAQRFGYSSGRFSHLFNDNIGCGLTEYVNSLRCRGAATMMRDGVPMIDAALGSGFECMRTFYRAFRRCFGETPTRYLSGTDSNVPKSGKERGAFPPPIRLTEPFR